MSNLIKKLFGTLAQKPWEKEQAAIDTYHSGKTFNLSKQTSAVIVIFGVSTVLFSLILTGYLYTIPPEQDVKFLFKPNMLWLNTIVLFIVTYYFSKITKDLKKTSEELLKYCKDGLAPYKYPRWFQFPSELPKTATGKIQRFKLRSNLAN